MGVSVEGSLECRPLSVQGGGSLSKEGGSRPREVSVQGVSVGRPLPGESLSWGLCQGVLCPGGLCPGRSLSRGISLLEVSVQGVLCQGGICQGQNARML